MTTKARFLSHVNKNSDGCWVWKGGLHKRGYGIFWLEGKGQLAHRISFSLFKRDLKPTENVLHKCDNPQCVNPKHLIAGTQADNMRDMIEKGRDRKAFGENAGKAKLTEVDVKIIRSSNSTALELAEIFGVSRSQIYYIRNRTNWKHL